MERVTSDTQGSSLVVFIARSVGELHRLSEDFKGPPGTHLLVICQFENGREHSELSPFQRTPFSSANITVLQAHDLKRGCIFQIAIHFSIKNGFQFLAGLFDADTHTLSEALEALNEAKKDRLQGDVFLIRPAPQRNTADTFLGPIISVLVSLPPSFLQTFRALGVFSVKALSGVPFERNSSGPRFDPELMIQLRGSGSRFIELSTPRLRVRDENTTRSYLRLIRQLLLLRLQRLAIFYDPRYDLIEANNQYQAKFDFVSSHSLAVSKIARSDELLILGSGPRELVTPFAESSSSVVSVDSFVDDELRNICSFALQADLEEIDCFDNIAPERSYSKVIALDIIEHLRSPELFLDRLRRSYSTAGAALILTTPNIAFLPIRLMLLAGSFNYGKRGILDRTHTRLFTFASLRRVLEQSGFIVEEMRGIPAPIPLALGRNILSSLLLKLNDLMIRLLPTLFSFQILAVARALPTVEQLLKATETESEAERALG